jgi:hypothetical protein
MKQSPSWEVDCRSHGQYICRSASWGISGYFMELEGKLSCSQELAILSQMNLVHNVERIVFYFHFKDGTFVYVRSTANPP